MGHGRTLERVVAGALVGICISLAATPPCAAQQSDPAEATRYGEQGLKLYESGSWDDAYEAFRRANELYSAPPFAVYMAHCRRQRGRFVEARALYERVAQLELAADAPSQFLQARATARAELAALGPRIASLRVRLEPQAPGVQLRIDGGLVAAGVHVDVDPGEHVVEISGSEVGQRVSLREGQRLEVVLNGSALARTDGAGQATPAPSPVPAIVAFGVGGAALLAGAITGAISIAKTSDIEDQCPSEQSCSSEVADDIDSATVLANVSNVSFVIAGVAAATGVVLLLVTPGEDDAPPSTALAAILSPASASLRLRF